MYTIDNFLGGFIKLKQMKNGLRVTSDAVLLAAEIPDEAEGTLLDVGCAGGIIAISIAKRAAKINAIGIDVQPELIEIACENAQINNVSLKVKFKVADIMKKETLKGCQFDFVITNPPFYSEANQNKQMEKFIANHENSPQMLENWLNASIKHLKPKGKIITINKTENLPEILTVMSKKIGNIKIKPIYSKQNKNAERIIVSGIMNSKTKLVIEEPIIVHNQNGSFTEKTEKILRYIKD